MCTGSTDYGCRLPGGMRSCRVGCDASTSLALPARLHAHVCHAQGSKTHMNGVYQGSTESSGPSGSPHVGQEHPTFKHALLHLLVHCLVLVVVDLHGIQAVHHQGCILGVLLRSQSCESACNHVGEAPPVVCLKVGTTLRVPQHPPAGALGGPPGQAGSRMQARHGRPASDRTCCTPGVQYRRYSSSVTGGMAREGAAASVADEGQVCLSWGCWGRQKAHHTTNHGGASGSLTHMPHAVTLYMKIVPPPTIASQLLLLSCPCQPTRPPTHLLSLAERLAGHQLQLALDRLDLMRAAPVVVGHVIDGPVSSLGVRQRGKCELGVRPACSLVRAWLSMSWMGL